MGEAENKIFVYGINWNSLIAGGCSGLAVDMTLYPVDTMKTRLQSYRGFFKSGGFRKLYSGLTPVIVQSVPTAGIFFMTYDSLKKMFNVGDEFNLKSLMMASVGAEVASGTFRVPFELVKQNLQANSSMTISRIMSSVYRKKGVLGFYNGLAATLCRDIPFVLVEMSLWEYLKTRVSIYQNKKCDPLQSGACGGLAGAVSGFLTTPLDVAKTQIMLNYSQKANNVMAIYNVMQHIYRKKGIKKLYSGASTRIFTISVGGALFFGMYDFCLTLL